MSEKYVAQYPAAFINEIYENGTKEEALLYLQKTWDDYQNLKHCLNQALEIHKRCATC